MISISLCMIVKNEEETLARCLESVGEAVDEIIIADTGSTDATKEIASKYTDKIYDFKWIDDFSAARNFAFSKATKDYIFWLDADDILKPEDKAKLLKLKQNLDGDIDVVMMKYNTAFDEKGRPTFSFFRERLSRRSLGFKWHEPVHEYLAYYGKSINSDIAVTHAKDHSKPKSGENRNLRIYEAVISSGKALSPRGMYYYARELKDNGRFAEAAAMFEKFLESRAGWVEDNITACGELSRCYTVLKQGDKALAALFKSFSYDLPRAELCCDIGYYFKNRGDFQKAAFWFELVLGLQKPENSLGFIRPDCWGYIPSLECAVCHDALGNLRLAESYNEMAAAFKPDSKAVAFNRDYFRRKLK